MLSDPLSDALCSSLHENQQTCVNNFSKLFFCNKDIFMVMFKLPKCQQFHPISDAYNYVCILGPVHQSCTCLEDKDGFTIREQWTHASQKKGFSAYDI